MAKEAIVKYVVSWKRRYSGSAAENEANSARLLQMYSEWAPASDVTIHHFVSRVDGEGGFTVAESDDPARLALSLYKLSPFLQYEVHPVIDIGETAELLAEAVEWRKSIT